MADQAARLKTTGMHCGSCAMMIQMTLEDVPGVASAKTDYPTGMTEVVYDPEKTDVAAIIAAIEGAGYGAELAA